MAGRRRAELGATAETARELAEALDALLAEAGQRERLRLQKTTVRIGVLRLISQKVCERLLILEEGLNDD